MLVIGGRFEEIGGEGAGRVDFCGRYSVVFGVFTFADVWEDRWICDALPMTPNVSNA